MAEHTCPSATETKMGRGVVCGTCLPAKLTKLVTSKFSKRALASTHLSTCLHTHLHSYVSKHMQTYMCHIPHRQQKHYDQIVKRSYNFSPICLYTEKYLLWAILLNFDTIMFIIYDNPLWLTKFIFLPLCSSICKNSFPLKLNLNIISPLTYLFFR